MPNTILHFGINSDFAFLWRKHFDLPVLILINIFINFESYVTIILRSAYPQHGYLHTFLFGTILAIFTAILLYSLKNMLTKLMNFLRFEYETSFKKMLISSIFGAWLHILLDAPVYAEMRPFFPFKANPLYGLVSIFAMNLICIIFFIPAIIMFYRNRIKKAGA